MVDRPRREGHLTALEARVCPPPEPHDRWLAERNPYYMLENRTVFVPADGGPGIIPDHQRLNEFVRTQPGKLRGTLLQRIEPVWDRISWCEPAILKVITPTKTAGETLARPLLELEWREVRSVDATDQIAFLIVGEHFSAELKARQERSAKEIRDHPSERHERLNRLGIDLNNPEHPGRRHGEYVDLGHRMIQPLHNLTPLDDCAVPFLEG